MKFYFKGKNIDVTEGLRTKVESKISKLSKLLTEEVDVHVTMSVEGIWHKVEITIPYNGIVFKAEDVGEDMYASIDKIVDLVERQIRKNKTKLEKKKYIAFDELDVDFDDEDDEKEEFQIVRSKKFAAKPMDVEEAILQMNLIGHDFFVFFNMDTEKINVVYRRKKGDYGLIEPEF